MPPDAAPPPNDPVAVNASPRREPGDGRARLINALATAVRALHRAERRGDLAELRRMDPGPAIEPAFQRILVAIDPGASQPWAQRIALLVKILALPMSADGLDGDPKPVLGRALRRIDVKERRIQTLMTARGPTLDDLLVRLARRLVREGALPYAEIGRLVLSRHDDELEGIRFRIARGYWTEDRSHAEAAGAAGEQASRAGDIE